MMPHLSPLARAILDADYANVRSITGAVPKDSPLATTYQALRKTADAIENIIPVDKAISSLRDAIHRPPDDAELFFLLLGMGVRLSNNLNLVGDSQRFSLLMKELLNNIPHPEFKSFWLLNESYRHLAVLNFSDCRIALDEALSLDISRDTGLWLRLKYNHASVAITEFDFLTAVKDIAEIEPLLQQHRRFVNIFQFLKARLFRYIRNTDEAITILKTIPPIDPAPRTLRFDLLFDAGRWEEYDQELAAIEKSPVSGFTSADTTLLRSWSALGQENLKIARELFREALSLVSTVSHRHFHLASSIEGLASVELSLRNPKAARTLLKMLDPQASSLLYCTYWMRLFLLENNTPQATLSLKRMLDIKHYGTKILVCNLREAHEVSAYQIEKLRDIVSQIPSPTPAPSASPSEPAPFPTLLGENAAIRKAKTLIRKYAPLDTTVLITGETGTGKDVIARMIHESSSRAGHPFIAVNCASISDSLMEAELFGYVKGAFTGASSNHDGLFTTAGKGTLFLDDVESMPARLQAGLLRVLESGEIRPVGGTNIRKTTARIVAATNVPLDEIVKKGTFREDLFYRLARFEIALPPLRERKDDIP
ncbi:MAG: sigma-54 factor interaction domain-containing protein, partial [Planctomycetota bacterium]